MCGNRANGRLRWVCVLPLLSLPDSIDMLPWCKQDGAVAVLMRPFEGDRLIQDPYFHPLYEAMTKHDLPVGMHIGNANPNIIDTTRQRVGYRGRLLEHVGKHRRRVPRRNHQQAA